MFFLTCLATSEWPLPSRSQQQPLPAPTPLIQPKISPDMAKHPLEGDPLPRGATALPIILKHGDTFRPTQTFRLRLEFRGSTVIQILAPGGGCVCARAQSCPTLCDPMDYSPSGSSVHGILQARILEWVAISFSRGSSPLRDQTHVSCLAGGFFDHCITWEASWKPGQDA